MTIQDRILVYLSEHPEGVDDDGLSAALNLRARQQANQRCRRMECFGIISRRKVNGKIRNYLNPEAALLTAERRQSVSDDIERPWYWEGSVQAVVASYLENSGYRIESTANTATKEQGKDIVAVTPSGNTLWISAKGYPAGTVKTNPRTQARHWFAHALFDLILWHGQDEQAELALALPEQVTYRNLSIRIGWFFAATNAKIFWVREDGSVIVQES